MKHKLRIMIILMLILVLPLVLAETCPANNQIDVKQIPCEGITPVINNCSIFDIRIVDLNDSDPDITFNLTLKTANIYNFSFNYTEKATYQLFLCDNSTATMVVGDFLDFYASQTYIYIFMALAGLALLGSGLWLKKEYMVFFAGLTFIILGLFVWVNGIAEVDSLLLQRAIFVTMIGAGGYFMITAYPIGGHDGNTD